MLKSPIRKIRGYGQFKYYENLSINNAWNKYGKLNGVRDLKNYIKNFNLEKLSKIASKFNYKKFKVKELAKKAKMKDVYFYLYHKLCEDIHTNVNSLNCYMERHYNNIDVLNPLPKYSDQRLVLITLIWIMLRAMLDLDRFLVLTVRNRIEAIEIKIKPYLETSAII